MGQGGAVEHVHGEVGRRAVVQLDDAGADVSGLIVGQGPVPGEVPGAGAGEEVQQQPGADVDAVQLVGVLVAELAGDDPALGRSTGCRSYTNWTCCGGSPSPASPVGGSPVAAPPSPPHAAA